ncbi:MAG: dihydrofolate reductase [Pseudomonadota bacterium]
MSARINIIVATAANGVIGRDGDLPWHISADLKRFKRITMGHPIVMGRKTFESLPRGPLPGRRNIIVTRQQKYENRTLSKDCLVVDSMSAAITATVSHDEMMVIGGAALYAEALPVSRRIFLTEVHAEVEGDVYCPPIERPQWTETLRSSNLREAGDPFDHSFVVLERA